MPGAGHWLVPIVVSAAGFADVAGAEEPWTGLLAEMCAACHGETGRSQGSVPDISELDPEAMQAFLIGFRDGDIEATVMGRFAKALSDSDIEDPGPDIGRKPGNCCRVCRIGNMTASDHFGTRRDLLKFAGATAVAGAFANRAFADARGSVVVVAADSAAPPARGICAAWRPVST